MEQLSVELASLVQEHEQPDDTEGDEQQADAEHELPWHRDEDEMMAGLNSRPNRRVNGNRSHQGAFPS